MIRLLIADDHDLVREGLRRLFQVEGDIEVIGEAKDGLEVQRKAMELGPDVILMDVSMPIIDGISATREIVRQVPGAKVVILSMHAEESHLFLALRAGAAGYVLKSGGIENVLAAVRAAAVGGGMIAPSLTEKMISEFRRMATRQGLDDGLGALSENEVRILQLIAGGLSNKEIARQLCLAQSTIKNRVSVIFQKIGVSDRTQAAIYAISRGVAPAVLSAETDVPLQTVGAAGKWGGRTTLEPRTGSRVSPGSLAGDERARHASA